VSRDAVLSLSSDKAFRADIALIILFVILIAFRAFGLSSG
jgi:hypothetical protein